MAFCWDPLRAFRDKMGMKKRINHFNLSTPKPRLLVYYIFVEYTCTSSPELATPFKLENELNNVEMG